DISACRCCVFFFQAEDGIRDGHVTGVQTCALPILQQLASGTIKKVTLELGGKSANIILDDADLEMAVDGSLFGCFFHQGQACESGTRLFVSERLHDDVVARLVERTKSLTIGDPMDFATAQGP